MSYGPDDNTTPDPDSDSGDNSWDDGAASEQGNVPDSDNLPDWQQ